MSKNIALAKFVEEIKRNSSRWIKGKGKEFEKFSWQKGYAGLSVSQSVLSKTKDYIENQKEHHTLAHGIALGYITFLNCALKEQYN